MPNPATNPASRGLSYIGPLTLYVISPAGELVRQTQVPTAAPVMMHDFAITERYARFLEAPAIFDVQAMMRGEPAMRWEPERGARLGVLPRRGAGDQVRWFEVDLCYVVHFWNAWDDGDRIEIHAPAFERMPGGLQAFAADAVQRALARPDGAFALDALIVTKEPAA